MSRTYKDSPKRKRERATKKGSSGPKESYAVRAIRRDPPDLRKFAKALIQLALTEAEADALQAGEPATEAASPLTADPEATQ